MRVTPTAFPEVLLIAPDLFSDDRGFFVETFRADRFREAGMPERFAQDCLSMSRRGVIRGIHFQNPHAQGKLVSVVAGEAFDVVVDLRSTSPTFGQWVGHTLSSTTRHLVYIPPGFGHGFCAISDQVLFSYKLTEVYHPEAEYTIVWNDPALKIAWPIAEPMVSAKDARGYSLRSIPQSILYA